MALGEACSLSGPLCPHPQSSSLDWRGRSKSGQLLPSCGLCPSGSTSPHCKMGTTKALPRLLGQQCFWTLTGIRVTQDRSDCREINLILSSFLFVLSLGLHISHVHRTTFSSHFRCYFYRKLYLYTPPTHTHPPLILGYVDP